MRISNVKLFGVIAVFLVGVAVTGMAKVQPEIELQDGTATLVRGESEKELKKASPPEPVKAGDLLVTGKESTGTIGLGKCGQLVLSPESELKIVRMELPEKKGTAWGRVHLQKGAMKASVGLQEKRKEKNEAKKTAPPCELDIQVGSASVRGNRYGAEVEYLDDGRYHASLEKGLAAVEHKTGLTILLRSGVVIDDGPPISTTADSSNDVPLAMSWPGSVVYAALPGQNVTIREVEGGVILRNEGENGNVYAIEWDGAPSVEIEPGSERFFGIITRDIPWPRKLAHTRRLAQVLRETYGSVLAGLAPLRGGAGDAVTERQGVLEQLRRFPARRRGGDTSPSR